MSSFIWYNGGRAFGRVVANSVPALNFARKTFCNGAIGGENNSGNHIRPGNAHGRKINMANSENQADVAIVGGGIVGVALACALSSMPLTKHLNIAIIDSNPALQLQQVIDKDSMPDSRVSTVTPTTISFFKDVDAWRHVQRHRHAYFDKMQVWDYTGLAYTRYNARDIEKDVLGCVVENKVLHSALMSCLQEKSGIIVKIYPARVVSIRLPSQLSYAGDKPFAELELNNGDSLCAKLVVGADGSKSQVREIAGFRTSGWNYEQNAVTCTVEHASENHCAWQRFLPAGPIALLPMGDCFSNIVWTMGTREASDHQSMMEDDFLKSLNHALKYGYGPHPDTVFLGQDGGFLSWFTGGCPLSAHECFEVPPDAIKVVSQRMSFPLSLKHVKQYVSHRVALIGDAAHLVHPLAGQGVNLGFGDVHVLSNVIADAVMVGSDIGGLSILKKYEKDRKLANVTMMAILDGFQKAFSIDHGPVNLLRAIAFHGAQYVGPLKRNIISYAAGEQKWPLFS